MYGTTIVTVDVLPPLVGGSRRRRGGYEQRAGPRAPRDPRQRARPVDDHALALPYERRWCCAVRVHSDGQHREVFRETDLLDPVLERDVAELANAALDHDCVVLARCIGGVREDILRGDRLNVVGASGGGGELVGGVVAEGDGLRARSDGAGVRVAGDDGRAPGVGGGCVDRRAVAAVGVADGILRDVRGDELALRGDGVRRGGGGRRDERVGGGVAGGGGGGGGGGVGGGVGGAVKTG